MARPMPNRLRKVEEALHGPETGFFPNSLTDPTAGEPSTRRSLKWRSRVGKASRERTQSRRLGSFCQNRALNFIRTIIPYISAESCSACSRHRCASLAGTSSPAKVWARRVEQQASFHWTWPERCWPARTRSRSEEAVRALTSQPQNDRLSHAAVLTSGSRRWGRSLEQTIRPGPGRYADVGCRICGYHEPDLLRRLVLYADIAHRL